MDLGDVRGKRNLVVEIIGIFDLPVGSAVDLLHERITQALRNSALDLPLDERRINGPPRVMGGDDPHDLYLSGLNIHLDFSSLCSETISGGDISHPRLAVDFVARRIIETLSN